MIIGLSGIKQSGKDTVCKIIQYLTTYPDSNGTTDGSSKNRSYNSFIIDLELGFDPIWSNKKFADALKNIVCLLINCTREQLEDSVFKETPLGEEWRRWAYSHYKLKNNNNEGIVSPYFASREEAMVYEFPKLNGQTVWELDSLSLENQILTPRLLLQLLGTECGRRVIHPNIWVNVLMSEYIEDVGYQYDIRPLGGLGMSDLQLEKTVQVEVTSDPKPFNNGYPNWIITDVRFPNEAKAIKDRGGLIFKINSNRIVSTDLHESETALDNYKEFDDTINNHWDIPKLIDTMKQVLQIHKIL